jgi:hypothetical protein
MQHLNKRVNAIAQTEADTNRQLLNTSTDTVTVIPIVDFGWPLIGETKDNKDTIVIHRKEEYPRQ